MAKKETKVFSNSRKLWFLYFAQIQQDPACFRQIDHGVLIVVELRLTDIHLNRRHTFRCIQYEMHCYSWCCFFDVDDKEGSMMEWVMQRCILWLKSMYDATPLSTMLEWYSKRSIWFLNFIIILNMGLAVNQNRFLWITFWRRSCWASY